MASMAISQQQWEELAEKAFKRLEESLDCLGPEDQKLLGSIKETMDRAWGKALERAEISADVTTHEAIEEEQLKRFAKRHVKGKAES